MRYVTAGESHGPAVIAIVVDVPKGVPIDAGTIDRELARRQVGYGRGGRMSIETDRAEVLSGVRHGKTLGTPVCLLVRNKDASNWADVMAPFGEATSERSVTAPRPGHADLPGVLKTGATDVRDVLERSSARETAGRVAAGAVAKALLHAVGVEIRSAVVAIGGVSLDAELDPGSFDVESLEANDLRCPDAQTAARMRAAIDEAREAGESLGGEFVVWATGAVPGIGGYASAADRLDGRIAGAIMSIPAIKAVAIGEGLRIAAIPGSKAHDEIVIEGGEYSRRTNHAGGIEGGMANGQTIVVRAAMKPIPTLMKPLETVDIASGESVAAATERSDVCAVPAAGVVAEAELALVLADAYMDKFGGDCLRDMLASLEAYRARIRP